MTIHKRDGLTTPSDDAGQLELETPVSIAGACIYISGAVHVKMLGANSTRPIRSKKTDERVKEDYPFLYGKSRVFLRFFF